MRVGIIGDSLSGLTLAKTLVNQNIHVDNLTKKKKLFQTTQEQLEYPKVILSFLIKI